MVNKIPDNNKIPDASSEIFLVDSSQTNRISSLPFSSGNKNHSDNKH